SVWRSPSFEGGIPWEKLVNLLHKSFRHSTLLNKPISTAPHAFFPQRQPTELRDDHNTKFGKKPAQLCCRFESVEERHAHGREHQVGTQAPCLLHQTKAIRRSSHDFECSFELEVPANASKRRCRIIGH